MKINIARISLSDVLACGEDRYNSNNHWKDGIRPKDYDKVVGQGRTHNWIDLFHKDYKKLKIDKKETIWMNEAFKAGRILREMSSTYNEELDDLLEKYGNELGGEYFIRTKYNSLKNGKYGTGPYKNLREVIISMVTTTDGHRCFELGEHIQIYLMKWIPNFNTDKEFRIFVRNSKITCVSQQHLYSDNLWLEDKSEDFIKDIVERIINYHNKEVSKRVEYIDDYVYDFAFIGDKNEPYFIEINSFGEEYASGSSLFHWIIDKELLYDSKEVDFRYVWN